jgi:hypothetical protein
MCFYQCASGTVLPSVHVHGIMLLFCAFFENGHMHFHWILQVVGGMLLGWCYASGLWWLS